MAYGDGGYYFLQPVGQPAGAYGAFGSYGELKKGRKFLGYQLLYQSKAPKSHIDQEREVHQLLTIVTRLKTDRTKTRTAIKRLRKELLDLGLPPLPGAKLFAKFPFNKQAQIQKEIDALQGRVKILNKAIGLALKNFKKAKERLAKRTRASKPGRVSTPEQEAELAEAVAEKNAAVAELQDEIVEEAEANLPAQPEDTPAPDEVVVDEFKGEINDMPANMTGGFFEENKMLIYLLGGGALAFFAYRAMK